MLSITGHVDLFLFMDCFHVVLLMPSVLSVLCITEGKYHGAVEDWFNTYIGRLQDAFWYTNVWFMLITS